MHRLNPARYRTFFISLIASTVVVGGAGYLYSIKSESFPGYLLACGAGYFAYRAYLHTLEKFRLDLFDRRYPIYMATTKLCNEGAEIGIGRAALVYRGQKDSLYQTSIAGNKELTRLLFGSEIYALAKELNSLIDDELCESVNNAGMIEYPRNKTHTQRIKVIRDSLPESFDPYLNFGRYR